MKYNFVKLNSHISSDLEVLPSIMDIKPSMLLIKAKHKATYDSMAMYELSMRVAYRTIAFLFSKSPQDVLHQMRSRFADDRNARCNVKNHSLSDMADIINVAYMAMFETSKTGCDKHTAIKVARKAIRNYVYSQRSAMRGRYKTVYFADLQRDEDDNIIDVGYLRIDKYYDVSSYEDLSIIHSLIGLMDLTESERTILNYRMGGYSQRQIAGKMHLSQPRVFHVLHAIRKKAYAYARFDPFFKRQKQMVCNERARHEYETLVPSYPGKKDINNFKTVNGLRVYNPDMNSEWRKGNNRKIEFETMVPAENVVFKCALPIVRVENDTRVTRVPDNYDMLRYYLHKYNRNAHNVKSAYINGMEKDKWYKAQVDGMFEAQLQAMRIMKTMR